MKSTIRAATLLVLFFWFVIACQKSNLNSIDPAENSTGKFLRLPAGSPSYIQRIAGKIYEQELHAPFLSRIEKEEGIPVWDKAEVQSLALAGSANDTLVLLPLVLENHKQTNGFLVCKVGINDVEIVDLVRSRFYEAYGFDEDQHRVTANTVVFQSLLFDKKIFGDSTFKIMDSRLFKNKTSKRISNGEESIRLEASSTNDKVSNRYVPITQCYTVTHKGDQGNLTGTAPGESNDYYWAEEICYTDLIFVQDPVPTPGGGFTIPGGGSTIQPIGGGGGGGSGSKPVDWGDACKNGKIKIKMLPSNIIKEISCGNTINWKPDLKFSYTLTDADRKIINQVRDEDKKADEILDAPPGCYGTNALGNINRDGTLQHWLIQYDYLATHPTSVREYSIPLASKLGTWRGRADLADLGTYEMFEIKPAGLAATGALEVNNYVDKANKFCPPSMDGSPKKWTPGITYQTRTLPYPPDPTKVLEAKLVQAGVITYNLVQKSLSPSPFPVTMPQKIRDRIKDLLKQLKKDTKDLEEKILVYLRQNPEIITYLKTAAVGAAVAIIVGTIVEDVLTLGAGVADDWASFWMAYKLIRIARLL